MLRMNSASNRQEDKNNLITANGENQEYDMGTSPLGSEMIMKKRMF